jgi:hypothetical protein
MANSRVIGLDDIGPIFAEDDDQKPRIQAAFPSGDGQYGGGPNHDPGMSLRDYFAGHALIAISTRWGGTLGDIDNAAAMRSAVIAYEIADAMLKERDGA